MFYFYAKDADKKNIWALTLALFVSSKGTLSIKNQKTMIYPEMVMLPSSWAQKLATD